MKHLAAYLLLVLGGKATPSEDDITKVLASVGVEPEKERVTKLLSELEGKNINELVAAGAAKLASVPSGGAGGASSGGAAAASGTAPEEKAEEKEEEKEEESDEDMGFGLFD